MLKSLKISGFKSFGTKTEMKFDAPISAIVGPNGSGKSNTAEAFRFVLGEQSLKALRASHSDELLFNGGQDGNPKHRAHVKAAFDNSQNHLDIDYDEVVVERIIERGEASTYKINGSRVRLKDVMDLLSDANIGTSRHHIISQGEADRVLSVSKRERKSIIEDALGLRKYYRRRREAENKLARTEKNLKEAKSHRQDLLPELKYFKKQIARIKKAKEIRANLTGKYQQFFCRQSVLIDGHQKRLEETKEKLKKKQKNQSQRLQKLQKNQENTTASQDDSIKKELDSIESQIGKLETKRDQITTAIGRTDGALSSLKDRQAKSEAKTRVSVDTSQDTFKSHVTKLKKMVKNPGAHSHEAILETLSAFLKMFDVSTTEAQNFSDEIAKKEQALKAQKKQKQELQNKYETLQRKKEALLQEKQDKKDTEHKEQKEAIELRSNLKITRSKLANIKEKLQILESRKNDFREEISEAKVLCGEAAVSFEDAGLMHDSEEITKEDLLKKVSVSNLQFDREIERLKVKLEQTRVSDERDVEAEHARLAARVDFYDREISDLEASQSDIQGLITDINNTAQEKFAVGIKEINETFDDFFSTMFGGGGAELFLTTHPKGRNVEVKNIDENPAETEQGVGVRVKLPRKKVRGLDVLSGGERALVSTALLFSLSQINPPPFIVLDEADAALDEANSRRFGTMVEGLAEHSQLIVITHNRETMRRADRLYGVTMDQAGGSRLLSLNLADALTHTEND